MRSDFEFQQLEQFVTVARTKNFTRAAKELNLSQSSLSRAILKLEDQLGQPLFERKPREGRPNRSRGTPARTCQGNPEACRRYFFPSIRSQAARSNSSWCNPHNRSVFSPRSAEWFCEKASQYHCDCSGRHDGQPHPALQPR